MAEGPMLREEAHRDRLPVGQPFTQRASGAGGEWSRGMGSSEALPSCQRWRINELVRKKKRGCKGGWIHPRGRRQGCGYQGFGGGMNHPAQLRIPGRGWDAGKPRR